MRPTTCAALGIAGLKKSQAPVPSLDGTIVAGSFWPDRSKTLEPHAKRGTGQLFG